MTTLHQKVPAAVVLYVYRWNRQGRKGQHCEVIARGTMNSCCVRFADGYTMVTSRNALAKVKEWTNVSPTTHSA